MKHTIETSTSAINHFVYRGTYETYIGESLYGVAPDMREKAEDAIGELAVKIISDEFGYIFPDDDFNFYYLRTYHPNFYNFETDSVIFKFDYNDSIYNWLCGYAITNQLEFDKFLNDNYTSYDGFISFTPNNWNDWLSGWRKDDWRCVSALLNFIIYSEINVEDCNMSFDDDARTIIEENFINSEYAVKYDNGCIGVVRYDYDADDECDKFNCYLFDASGKIVNECVMDDAYYEFNGSAYGVYQEIEYDLTNKFSLCGTHCIQCEIPEF